MQYKFIVYGHPNILGTHKTTLEFTKDEEVSLRGDCIIGVNADFDLSEIKKFIKNLKNKKITITIKAMSKSISIKEPISAEVNPNFSSGREFVIRKTDFISERTFAVRAGKSAFELDRKLIKFLRKKNNKAMVVVEN